MNAPISSVLARLATERPEDPAVTCDARTATIGELERRSNRLARAYADLGVSEGDYVTIGLPNSIEFVEAAYAVWKLGAVPQPVSSRLPDRERATIIELANSRLVVGAAPGSHGERLCLAEGFEPDPELGDGPLASRRVSPAFKAPTSGGSTGRPKLIVSGQNGAIDPRLGESLGLIDGSIVLVPGPLYHNAPFLFTFAGLFMGVHIVLMPRFEAGAALRLIETHRVDVVNFAPTMLLRMWRVLERDESAYDLSSLRIMWHMAAPCPQWLKRKWIDVVGAEKVYEMYGGTEAQSATIITGVEWLEHQGSVGKPVYGQMKILGPDGEELAPGAVGEIYMLGDPAIGPTYRYIGAEPRERDGWESLGDLGWMDEDGYLYISDRRTDMILSGGANVYPAEVEAALMEHPGVESVVVVGLPDEDLGQQVHAVIQAPSELTGDELADFLRERIVSYKIPRSFTFVDETLRDDAGKARRSAIRDAVMTDLPGGLHSGQPTEV
jgi:bile acid-coenzyme A ligase